MYISSYPNRTLCDVLEDMRRCDKTKNYASILALIEEVQYLGNKMEAGLSDKSDIKDFLKERSKLRKEVKKLIEQKEELEDQVTELDQIKGELENETKEV